MKDLLIDNILPIIMLKNKINWYRFDYDKSLKAVIVTLPFYRYIFKKNKIVNLIKERIPAGIAVICKKLI